MKGKINELGTNVIKRTLGVQNECKGYQPRTNIIKDENDNLRTYRFIIFRLSGKSALVSY
jgi:hypothetical protein